MTQFSDQERSMVEAARRRTNLIKGLLFISLGMSGCWNFTVYPIGASLYYSFRL